MRFRFSLPIAVVLLAAAMGYGQGRGASIVESGATKAPRIDALSPNSAMRGGPTFTLSVVGRDFTDTSKVIWNGEEMETRFVSSQLLTASVPASYLLQGGPDFVTVFTPRVGNSNSTEFTVPCVIPPPSGAANQTRAQLGAYYFDGWSGPLTNFHFEGLPLGPFQGRQPFSGWQDSGQCAVEEQLATAHNFGVDFFVFDWYYRATVAEPSDNLNSALEITHALPDRHGMKYAILYVDGPPFVISAKEWPAAVQEWFEYMKDPAYLRVHGMPALFIIDVGEMYGVFGSDARVAAALQQLRAEAQEQGLPGVYVIGGFGVPDGTIGQNTLASGFEIANADGYDAVAFYNYPFAPPAVKGELPFSELAASAFWTWDEAKRDSTIPFITTAMAGWDPRPWHEVEPISGDLMWYARTPEDVSSLLLDAINWANANPKLRPEPSTEPPLVLIEAWNEFGEGSHIVPTTEDGTSYGDAIETMLEK